MERYSLQPGRTEAGAVVVWHIIDSGFANDPRCQEVVESFVAGPEEQGCCRDCAIAIAEREAGIRCDELNDLEHERLCEFLDDDREVLS